MAEIANRHVNIIKTKLEQENITTNEIASLKEQTLEELDSKKMYSIKDADHFYMRNYSLGETRTNRKWSFGIIEDFRFLRFSANNCTFHNLIFKNVDMRDVRFFNDVFFINSFFFNVKIFEQSELKNVYFVNCIFEDTYLNDSTLKNCYFYHCNTKKLFISDDIDQSTVMMIQENVNQNACGNLPQTKISKGSEKSMNELNYSNENEMESEPQKKQQLKYSLVEKRLENESTYQFNSFKTDNFISIRNTLIEKITFADCKFNFEENISNLTFKECVFFKCEFEGDSSFFIASNFIDCEFENITITSLIAQCHFNKCKFITSDIQNEFTLCEFENVDFDDKMYYLRKMNDCKVYPEENEDFILNNEKEQLLGYKNILLECLKQLKKVCYQDSDKRLVDDLEMITRQIASKQDYRSDTIGFVKKSIGTLNTEELKKLHNIIQEELFNHLQ